MNCIFCEIIADPAKLIWRDNDVAAFWDIKRDAPVHVLVVSKAHIANLDSCDDLELAGKLLTAARQVARQEGIAEAYQVRINNGRGAGQIIDHLHLHVLGGWTSNKVHK